MASDRLQQQFTDLELHHFASDGAAPRAILTKALEDNPDLLTHSFLGSDGKATTLLAELIRVEKPALAMMVLKDFKDKIPEAVIKGYAVAGEEPVLALAARRYSGIAIELMERGAPLTGLTADGGTLYHQLMAKSSPATIKTVLEHLEKKIPAEQRATLFATADSKGKKPLELMAYPPNLVPFVEEGYVPKADMAKMGDAWLEARKKTLDAVTTLDQNFDTALRETIYMHEALQKAGLPRPVAHVTGEKVVSFGRSDGRAGGYCTMKLMMLCDHADQSTKNSWLSKAVPYQQDMRFPVAGADALLQKGAKATDHHVVQTAIYAEEIETVAGLLASCQNNPKVFDNATSSSLAYAITCGFAAEQKRLPIISLLVKNGAAVNEKSYHLPMRNKIACLDTTSQSMLIANCQKHCLPYPEGLSEAVQKKWAL
ncbi:MAG: hypothetical protein K2Q01_08465, partial [Rickettsiales bacterium]|nr:hypothetical protein [Rickettsiales bacterium]